MALSEWGFALGVEADTGRWLRPAQYERITRAGGNAILFMLLQLLIDTD